MRNLRLDVKVGGADERKWPNGEYADCRDILLTETIDISKKKQIPRPKLILFPRNETETKLPNAKWLTSSISWQVSTLHNKE